MLRAWDLQKWKSVVPTKSFSQSKLVVAFDVNSPINYQHECVQASEFLPYGETVFKCTRCTIDAKQEKFLEESIWDGMS